MTSDMQLTRKTEAAFRRSLSAHGLIRADHHYLLAFSGGADSTALLHLLHTLCQKQKNKPRITALHVNHGIRGEEAQRDANFCAAFCAARGIPFVLFEADVPAEAARRGTTLEETARDIRYACICTHLASHPDITHVLTAHHANYQAETVLFRLLRGTALHGLSGIPAQRPLTVTDADGTTRTVPLLRPLLQIPRSRLQAYLKEQGVVHVTDSTNAQNDASRNRLRNALLPTAAAVNPGFADALLRLADDAREDEAYFDLRITAFFAEHGCTAADPIPRQALLDQPPAVLRRILSAVYDAHRTRIPTLKPLTHAVLDSMRTAVRTGTRTALGAGYHFSADDGLCRIAQDQMTAPQAYRLPLPPGSVVTLPTGAACFFCDGSVTASENLQYLKNIYKFFISTHINSDTLIDSVYLRPRRDSKTDRYLCGGSHKTAKDALSAHHVPAQLRPDIPLFCDGGGIVWIPHCGIRDSVNPRMTDKGTICDFYYFYNNEVNNYASRY